MNGKTRTRNLSIFIIFISSFTFFSSASAYPFNSAEIIYEMSGIYSGSQLVALGNTRVSCIVNIDGNDVQVAISYELLDQTQSSLPYGIPKSWMVLTLEEEYDMSFQNSSIWEEQEQYPFVNWYGLSVYKTTTNYTDIKVELTWDKYKNILLKMVIYREEDPMNKITINYKSSNLDLYENYNIAEVAWFNFVTYVSSVEGIVLICVLVVASLILFSMLKKHVKRQKTRKRGLEGKQRMKMRPRARKFSSGRSRFI